MDIIKDIAAIVGLAATTFGLLTAIIKPLRQRIIESFIRKMKDDKRDAKIDNMDKKIDQILDKQVKFDTRLTSVENNVLTNEADRIRAELFDFGNRCRRGIRLHPEEMEHVRTIYHKYKLVLKQNHEGDEEFNYINSYYNNQFFPRYHTQIKKSEEE